MFDSGVNVRGFELVQMAPDRVEVNIWPIPDEASLNKLSSYINSYIKVLLGSNCQVELTPVAEPPTRKGKFRPIRRAFTP